MPDPNPTVDELFKAKAGIDEQVTAVVKEYLTKPETSAHPIADG